MPFNEITYTTAGIHSYDDSSGVSPYFLCFDGYATKYILCHQLGVNLRIIISHNRQLRVWCERHLMYSPLFKSQMHT